MLGVRHFAPGAAPGLHQRWRAVTGCGRVAPPEHATTSTPRGSSTACCGRA